MHCLYSKLQSSMKVFATWAADSMSQPFAMLRCALRGCFADTATSSTTSHDDSHCLQHLHAQQAGWARSTKSRQHARQNGQQDNPQPAALHVKSTTVPAAQQAETLNGDMQTDLTHHQHVAASQMMPKIVGALICMDVACRALPAPTTPTKTAKHGMLWYT